MIKNGFARFGFFRTALAVNIPLVLATSAFAQAPSPAPNETQVKLRPPGTRKRC